MQLHKQIHHHLRKHHKKYIFGLTLGGVGFFVVKVLISTVGFIGVFNNIRGVFAADLELNSGNITQAPFNCATSATSCNLSAKGITSIATDTFINHTNLQGLYLGYYNHITSIESGDFNGLVNLQELRLNDDQIVSIELGSFNGLMNLRNLYLDNNLLINIESGSLNSLTSLQNLYLSGNQLTGIELGDFNGLSNLTYLDLGNNQIASLEGGSFNGLTSLQTLQLYNNKLTSIELGDFNGPINLQSLALERNQIASIELGSFNGLASLTYLNLGSNQLMNLESGLFSGLTSLTSLGLGVNQLTNLESGLFSGLTGLTELSLGSNQISLESGLFNGLTNLQTLYLDNAQITGIKLGSFNGLTNLQTLYLGSNDITDIESGDFNGLTSLQSLYLHNNHIASLESGLFNQLTNLGSLLLYDNRITSIEEGSFNGLASLTYLNLANNKICTGSLSSSMIEFIDSKSGTEWSAINWQSSQDSTNSCPVYGCTDLTASNYNSGANIDDGSCTFYGCTDPIAENYNSGANTDDGSCIIYGCKDPNAENYNSSATNDDGSCTYPPLELNSGNITGKPFYCAIDATTCYLNSLGITSIARDTFINHTSLQKLYLYENHLTSIESGDFNGLTNLTYLGLDYNQLTSIESGSFNGMTNLTSLDLSYNRLTSIESGDFNGMTNLTSLDLDYNQLTGVEEGDFNGLINLQELYLNNNKLTSIESGDFNGLTNLIYLILNNNQLTSIESGSFNGMPNLQGLSLDNNQLTDIGSGNFNGLTNLLYINLFNNQLTDIESGTFNGLTGLQQLYLYGNCLNTEDSSLTDYLDTLGYKVANYGSQYVCLSVDYTPNTATTGSVIGGLSFAGPASYITSLETDNTNMSIYDHTYTTNGIHTYNYSGVVDTNGYLWTRYMSYPDIVTGNVTWIEEQEEEKDTEAPIVSGVSNGGEYKNSATFTVTDNVGVVSVTLNGNSLSSWTNHTVSTVGTYTLVAKDAANNTTTISFEVKKQSSGGGGGGGGGGGRIKDICPNGDYTKSLYDGKCGEKPTVATGTVPHGSAISTGTLFNRVVETIKTTITNIIENIIVQDKEELKDNIVNYKNEATKEELAEGYQFALKYGITTIPKIEDVNLDGVLIREEMAKMISNYMINVMGITGTKYSEKLCSKFKDLGKVTDEMKSYAVISCQLGLMGQDGNGGALASFNPRSEVTRAQFGTILSRMLRGTKYDKSGGNRYQKHLSVLNEKGIMKNIDNPNEKEKRGRVMVMMKRASDSLTK